MAQCTATTAKGIRCSYQAKEGADVCGRHGAGGQIGRPLKLKAELIAEIRGYVEKGVPKKHAARACGVAESTLYSWLETGEADIEHGKQTLFSDLVESLRQAESEFLAAHALNVSKHAVGFRDEKGGMVKGDPRMSTWLLERRGRDVTGDDWRPEIEVKHSGSVRTEPVEVPDDAERIGEVSTILVEIGVVGK